MYILREVMDSLFILVTLGLLLIALYRITIQAVLYILVFDFSEVK